jgi:lipopolysaccharide export system protein LptC
MQRRNILLILALIFIALTGLMLGLLSAKIEQAAENGRALSFEGNYLP